MIDNVEKRTVGRTLFCGWEGIAPFPEQRPDWKKESSLLRTEAEAV